jgi:hypothetical protein
LWYLKLCDTLVPLLRSGARVQVTPAAGSMYAFFRLDDATRFRSSLDVAKRLVLEAGLGLAPGNAHGQPGPDAQGWLRWCFASQDTARLGLGQWSAIGQAIIQDALGSAFVCLRRHAGQHTTSGHLAHVGTTASSLVGAGKKNHDCKINQS